MNTTTNNATVRINGFDYLRTGAPVYRIQVQSYRGGFLSTAVTTRERSNVGALACTQAQTFTSWDEARSLCFSDGLLTVTDKETVGLPGYNQGRSAVLSTYRWDPQAGKWTYSTGIRITALDNM